MDMEKMKRAISECLHSMGMSPEMSGFRFICDAVLLYIERECPETLSQTVFPAVAVNVGTSVAAVERACSAAVQYAWEHTAGSFPDDDPMKFDGQPTTVQLIRRVAELVQKAQ